MLTDTIRLLFSEADVASANKAWGCNCGPASLAACLGITLDAVRPFVERAGFSAAKSYMNPTMMGNAIKHAGAAMTKNWPGKAPRHGLARIQWHGPWTEPGASPKWAYRFTHWIAVWNGQSDPIVFDINGGRMSLGAWEAEIVPAIVSQIPRADGDWSVTHSMEVSK